MRRVNGSGVGSESVSSRVTKRRNNRCALSRLRVAFRDPSNRPGALTNYMIRQFHQQSDITISIFN